MKNKPNKENFSRKMPDLSGKGPNALWILLVFLFAGIAYLLWYNSMNHEYETVTFTKFLSQVESNEVKSIHIQGQQVEGKYKNDRLFVTTVAPSERMWESLRAHGVDVDVTQPEKQSWIYLLFISLLPFIFILIFFYYRQMQSGNSGSGKIFSVGKSKARFFSPNTITTTFKDVAGVQEAKEGLQDIIDFLKSPKKFERLGAKIPRGILLSGAPGNGKTLLAKAVAGEASCPFFSISGSDFVEVFVGVGASRVRDLFAQARKNAPCIVFIDEIDAVGRQRGVGLGGGNDEREQTLNQLLAEMDGFSTEPGTVIIIAATNRADVLDKALLRPGRFDRCIEVPYPDLTSRIEILNVHIKKVKVSPDVDLTKVARGTPGFSGADLENLINEAALAASKENKDFIEVTNFERARDQILLGGERKTLIFTDLEKSMTAYHEAGHTLLNLLLPHTDPFHKVTIIPRGRALGVSWSLPERDRHSHTKTEMLSRITVCFGGLIAEKLVFNEQTSGVSNDLEQATKLAQRMVRSFGMSELGPVDYTGSQEHSYLGSDSSKEISENTSQKIDAAVSKIINECLENGQKLLLENRDKLDLLAKTLLEKETLPAQEVYLLLGLTPRETHTF